MVLAWFGISIISMRFVPVKLKDINFNESFLLVFLPSSKT